MAGQGHFYCQFCCRFFGNASVLQEHERSKDHRKEVKKRKWDNAMDEKEAALVADYKRSRTSAPAATELPDKRHDSDQTIQSLLS